MNSYPLKKYADYVSEKISTSVLDVSDYVTTDNLLQNKQGITSATSLPAQSGKVTKYHRGDILLANIRPYLKKIWFSHKTGGCSADVLVFRAKENINPNFLYYALFRDDFFHHVMNGAKGTKMPRGDKTQIMEFFVPEFDKTKQYNIALTLASLDKKIDLNNRINTELESMAKILYNYWFVQFDFPDANGKPYKTSGGKMVYNSTLKREIPEGWEINTIADWIANDKNGDWGKDHPEGNYSLRVDCIRGTDINGINGIDSLEPPARFILSQNKSKLLNPYDLIIEISGGSPTQSTGRMAFITEASMKRFANPIICSNFCKAILLKDNTYFYNFAYQWKSIYQQGILFGWEGKTSGIKNLLFDAFANKYHVPKPPSMLANRFFETASKIEKQKQILLKQNSELCKLRDWLLPMLMNGQVTVK